MLFDLALLATSSHNAYSRLAVQFFSGHGVEIGL